MPSGPRFPHEAPLCRWCRVLSIAGFPSEDDDAVSAAVSCGLSCGSLGSAYRWTGDPQAVQSESLRAWSTIGTLAILDTLRVLWTVPAPLINWLSERKSYVPRMKGVDRWALICAWVGLATLLLRVMMAIEGYRD
ncbi:uncharacterized protein ATNIH1004_008123 [Aspergillus tanneri]|uniref:Uncharacterized protein n=1 Tax=Aspergillus tanneri TaxID=1220188 RepID=A0A5M9MMH7_9EURO|nr:uncharacterized protein ATNIH1004_008123 [Aspergillus tanneri]KAA8643927.1 hypothetical protein ATNIH1004_008123 [Aspergillus tanneri]